MGTTLSYWEKASFFTFDIGIIGSGIVGLTAAIALKQQYKNLSVAIFERGFLPSGASTKNAGFACFGSISELIEQEKSIGSDGLHRLIEKRWKGLLKLRKLVSDQNLSYKNYGGFELFKPTEDDLATACVAKIDHFNQLIEDIIPGSKSFGLAGDKVNTFGFKGIETLIENQHEGQIDTGKMMKHLLQLASSLGVVLYTSCPIEKISEEERHQILSTPHGPFKCTSVLLANNAFINELLPEIDVVPGRGQVLITKPIKKLRIKGTFHYDKGYYYFRNIDDRILLGGGRNLAFKEEQTATFGTTLIIRKALEQLLRETILPDIPFEIETSWSGIMGFGKQIDPIVRQIKPGIFCAVRCNGMGIAMGSQTGQDAAELILNSL